jgi:hypothetical protein
MLPWDQVPEERRAIGNLADPLDDELGLLNVRLAVWIARDGSKADPSVTRAGNQVVDSIDAMLRQLRQLRARMVAEQDIAAARADELLGVLGEDEDQAAAPVAGDTRRLAAIRALLARFDWERDDRQLALEAIDRIADGDEDQADEDEEPETYCRTCGADVGIFIGHGDAWLHCRGEGTASSPVELFDAGHAPEVAWRPAGAR